MEVIRVNVSADAVNFWNGLKLYYEQPKCINKQVLFSEPVFETEFSSSVSVTECLTLVDDLYFKLCEGSDFKVSTDIPKFSELKILRENDGDKIFACHKGKYLLCRRLIPKINVPENLNFYEFIFLDKSLSKVYISTKSLALKMYEKDLSVMEKKQDPLLILKFNFIQLNWCNKCLEVSYNESLSEKGITWLKATFIPKLLKLSNSIMYEKTNKKLSTLRFDDKVDIVQFYQLYEKMKLKYGKYFVENWTENTDPNKFVYEDIAIATYLILLWNKGKIPEENTNKQRFVDLGCGNGLLVHILNSEGHLGVGLDIRKRRIWDVYPPSTVLKEQTIIPSTDTIYPDADWLIGNHSDELTAWIPIMARLSNSHCQYFILPCCPYHLNGTKFQRKNTNLSSYQDFIGYLKQVSENCGFVTYIDKLRIPSTKRICLIGLNNPEMSKHNYSSLIKTAIGLAEQESQSLSFNQDKSNSKSEHQVSINVKIRNPVEAVRNCTQLSQGLIDNVLTGVMNELLKESDTCLVMKDGEQFTWNRGGKLSVGKLASCLDEQLLKQLKKECKGLQTLLKNQHFLFEVSQGHVQFRKPESLLEISKKVLNGQGKAKWKIKKCWFFNNHPDKCPLSDEICSYSHDI